MKARAYCAASGSREGEGECNPLSLRLARVQRWVVALDNAGHRRGIAARAYCSELNVCISTTL